jgi:O-methyltransferase
MEFSNIPELAVSVDKVRDNFSRYGLLDEQVRFLKGFFRDTLPTAQIERLALLRLDGDLYESTMQGLTYLYPKVSVGGFVIVDDYGALDACKRAVHDYLDSENLRPQIQRVDWTGAFWRKEE